MQRTRKPSPTWLKEAHVAWLMAGGFWAVVAPGTGVVWLLK